MVAIYSI